MNKEQAKKRIEELREELEGRLTSAELAIKLLATYHPTTE